MTGVWKERESDAAIAASLVALGQDPFIARMLAARGITPEDLPAFIDPSLNRLARAVDLPGVVKAVEVAYPFIRDKRKIVVFGDYDADGVCATAILVTALRKLGGVADGFIPDRFTEGYGMSEAALTRMMEKHPDVQLVISVDNGITAVEEVHSLRERGISVIVTDHHLPGEELPVPDALIDPKVAGCEGCENLCGAGVAFFFASALRDKAVVEGLYSGGSFSGPLLVLAGLATVTDIMPLLGQNRILVTAALQYFLKLAPVGLRELYHRAQPRLQQSLTTVDFAFTIGPRLNAAGRMNSAVWSYKLLVAPESERDLAKELAFKVDSFNVDRRSQEKRILDEAKEQIASFEGKSALVAQKADWHQGLIGLIAGRLCEASNLPVALISGSHGSARAPRGYNVHDALSEVSDLLERFGGHAGAAGFQVKDGYLDEFRARFAAACAKQEANAEDAGSVLFDGWLEPKDLTMDFYERCRTLAPFGEGNPEPLFGLRNVRFSEIRIIGSQGQHAAFAFVNRSIPRAVWWGHGDEAIEMRAHSAATYDVLFNLVTNDFGTDVPHLELKFVALRPSLNEASVKVTVS